MCVHARVGVCTRVWVFVYTHAFLPQALRRPWPGLLIKTSPHRTKAKDKHCIFQWPSDASEQAKLVNSAGGQGTHDMTTNVSRAGPLGLSRNFLAMAQGWACENPMVMCLALRPHLGSLTRASPSVLGDEAMQNTTPPPWDWQPPGTL